MFCTQCGSKNPDDYRFCEACGRPKASADRAAPREDARVAVQADCSQLARELKDTYLSAAAAYVRRGSTGTPFEGLEESGIIRRVLEQEFSKPDLAHLTRLDGGDSKINGFAAGTDESIDVWFTYLQMLRFLGEGLNDKEQGLGQGLVEAAFEARALLYFGSQLDSLADEKDWAGYDDLAQEYVEEAQGASPFQEMRAAVKAAHAKLMVGDRRAARAHAERVPALASAARAGKFYYTVMEPNLAREWIEKWNSDARHLLSTL